MGKPYRQCVECGHRALNFATRCPGCGLPLPDPVPFEPDARPELSRFLSIEVVVAVVAAGTLLASLQRAAAHQATLGAETSFVGPVAVERSTVARAVPPVRVSTSSGASVSSPSSPSLKSIPLVAKGWTHVHSRRSGNASLEAVLTPGDTVTADSLANGWYRVALYGDVLGYVKQSTLEPLP